MRFSSCVVCPAVMNSLALTALLLIVAGCGGGGPAKKPVGKVEGTVTFEGKPVEAGSVSLELKGGGGGALATIGAGGKFTIAEVPVGTYVVTVLPVELTPDDMADGKKAPPSDNIPEKYRSGQTSDLSTEIKEGANTVNVDMKP